MADRVTDGDVQLLVEREKRPRVQSSNNLPQKAATLLSEEIVLSTMNLRLPR